MTLVDQLTQRIIDLEQQLASHNSPSENTSSLAVPPAEAGTSAPADDSASNIDAADFPWHTMSPIPSEALFTLDENQHYTAVYSPTLTELGHPPAQIIGRHPRDIFPAHLAALHQQAGQQALQGRPVRYEWVYQNHHFQTTLVPQTNADGHITGIMGLERDITVARIETETSLRQLSQVVEQSPSSIIITDCDGTVEYVNPKFTEVTGYTAEEMVGKNPRLLKSGHTSTEGYRELWETITNGRTWRGEFHNRTKDGTYYWEDASISPLKDEHGRVTHYLAIKQDITEKKAMEEALRQKNRELRLLNRAGRMLNATLNLQEVLQVMLEETRRILNVVACSVWLVDTETQELVCHQVTSSLENVIVGWRLQPGQGVAGLVMQHGRGLIVEDALDDHRHFKEIDSLTGISLRSLLTVPLRSKERTLGVFQIVDEHPHRFNKDDLKLAESLAQVAATAIENARLHEDLHTQLEVLRQTQDQLVQHEKLAAIGELVAGVVHDLNNPLAAVLLHTQLLQQNPTLERKVQQSLDKIASQTRRASHVVRGLLDFTRRQPLAPQPVQLNELVMATLDLLDHELQAQSIHVTTWLEPNLPYITADLHQLQQVLVNLIQNATHALADQSVKRLEIYTAVDKNNHTLHLRISDNGPGIPATLQTRIFDPFFTTKPHGQGTGLGLSICQNIITQHGGHIGCVSQPGCTTFTLALPLTAVSVPEDHPTAPTQPHHAPTSRTTSPAGRALIVDDEPSVLQVLQQILYRQGFQTDTADNGREALQLVRQHNYDLILCDLHMPTMGGLEFHHHLSQNWPHLLSRLLLTTGDIVDEGVQNLLQTHDIPVLKKPFELNELKTFLEMMQTQTA